MRYNFFILSVLVFLSFPAFGQDKKERETRIKQGEFPRVAFSKLAPYLEDAKRIRFYKEFDGEKTSYEAKFKKGRLFYSVEFDETGVLEDVEFIIGKNDIPEDTYTQIIAYLKSKYHQKRIKKIQQQYPIQQHEQTTLKEAFQNLILPYINYELVIASKEKQGFVEYELLFDANGTFLSARKSVPQKYDHVLY